jgi:hypothetical protein
MVTGPGGGQDLGHVHGVLLGLGRVADRAAGEQPHRPVGQDGAEAAHQLPGRLQPVPGVDGAAQHDRVVAVDPLDLLGCGDRRVQVGRNEVTAGDGSWFLVEAYPIVPG